MMNQPHNYINKLRDSCNAMGKCRERTRKAERIKSYGAEPDVTPKEVSTGAASSLDANLKG
jgi:hypothetical protein